MVKMVVGVLASCSLSFGYGAERPPHARMTADRLMDQLEMVLARGREELVGVGGQWEGERIEHFSREIIDALTTLQDHFRVQKGERIPPEMQQYRQLTSEACGRLRDACARHISGSAHSLRDEIAGLQRQVRKLRRLTIRCNPEAAYYYCGAEEEDVKQEKAAGLWHWCVLVHHDPGKLAQAEYWWRAWSIARELSVVEQEQGLALLAQATQRVEHDEETKRVASDELSVSVSVSSGPVASGLPWEQRICDTAGQCINYGLTGLSMVGVVTGVLSSPLIVGGLSIAGWMGGRVVSGYMPAFLRKKYEASKLYYLQKLQEQAHARFAIWKQKAIVELVSRYVPGIPQGELAYAIDRLQQDAMSTPSSRNMEALCATVRHQSEQLIRSYTAPPTAWERARQPLRKKYDELVVQVAQPGVQPGMCALQLAKGQEAIVQVMHTLYSYVSQQTNATANDVIKLVETNLQKLSKQYGFLSFIVNPVVTAIQTIDHGQPIAEGLQTVQKQLGDILVALPQYAVQADGWEVEPYVLSPRCMPGATIELCEIEDVRRAKARYKLLCKTSVQDPQVEAQMYADISCYSREQLWWEGWFSLGGVLVTDQMRYRATAVQSVLAQIRREVAEHTKIQKGYLSDTLVRWAVRKAHDRAPLNGTLYHPFDTEGWWIRSWKERLCASAALAQVDCGHKLLNELVATVSKKDQGLCTTDDVRMRLWNMKARFIQEEGTIHTLLRQKQEALQQVRDRYNALHRWGLTWSSVQRILGAPLFYLIGRPVGWYKTRVELGAEQETLGRVAALLGKEQSQLARWRPHFDGLFGSIGLPVHAPTFNHIAWHHEHRRALHTVVAI